MKKRVTLMSIICVVAVCFLTACNNDAMSDAKTTTPETSKVPVFETANQICRFTADVVWNEVVPPWLSEQVCVPPKPGRTVYGDGALYEMLCKDNPVLHTNLEDVHVLGVFPLLNDAVRCGVKVHVNHPPAPDAVNKVSTQETMYLLWQTPSIKDFNSYLKHGTPVRNIVSIYPKMRYYRYCVSHKAECFYN